MNPIESIAPCMHREKLTPIFRFVHTPLLEEQNFTCSPPPSPNTFKTRIYSPTLVPWYNHIFKDRVWLLTKTQRWHREPAPACHTLTGAPAFLVKVTVWAPRETLAVQQHLGRPAGCAVTWALPSTPETGLVASWKTEDKAEETVRKVTVGQTQQLPLLLTFLGWNKLCTSVSFFPRTGHTAHILLSKGHILQSKHLWDPD